MNFKKGNSFKEETIIDLLTTEEKAVYYEIKVKIHSIDIVETKRQELHQEASKILLQAVNREITKRKENTQLTTMS